MAAARKPSAAKTAAAAAAAPTPARKPSAASSGSKSSAESAKSASSGTGSAGSAGAKKPSLKPGDPAAPPAVVLLGPLLGPDGKPVLDKDGKPIDLSTVVLGPDGKAIINPDGKHFDLANVQLGPEGLPILGPDGFPLLLRPPPPPKPYLGMPPSRWLKPPWEKSRWEGGPPPPQFIPWHPRMLKWKDLKLPHQIEFQDAYGDRTMINLKRTRYPRIVRLHLGSVGVTFEKHAGPCQCFLEVLCSDVPDFPELQKPQFSTNNFQPARDNRPWVTTAYWLKRANGIRSRL